MEPKPVSIHSQWSTPRAFVLATIGSVAGLGNIWRFPYLAGENGGVLFILLYLFCLLFLAVPIMMAALLLGRRGRRNPADTLQILAAGEKPGSKWKWLGMMIIIAGLMMLSYCSVIAGWFIAYAFRAAAGTFTGMNVNQTAEWFDALIADPEKLLAWHTIFTFITVTVVVRGVRDGLEQLARYVVPAMFILLLILLIDVVISSRFLDGLAYYLKSDIQNFDQIFLAALGHALFSLGLSVGALMMYGAYLPEQVSIPKSVFTIVAADTLIAVLGCCIIFPLLFSYGLESSQGPALAFITLPVAFGQSPAGMLTGALFFILLVLAAWLLAVSLLEPAVCWLIENRGMSRIRAGVTSGLIAWVLGLGMLLSFNFWAFPFSFAGADQANGIFDLFTILTTDIMLPLGALLMAIFAGWKTPAALTKDELKLNARYYALWRVAIRYIVPPGVILVMLDQLGMLWK